MQNVDLTVVFAGRFDLQVRGDFRTSFEVLGDRSVSMTVDGTGIIPGSPSLSVILREDNFDYLREDGDKILRED